MLTLRQKAKRLRAWRKKKARQGLCHQCGKRPVKRDADGRKMRTCEACLDYAAGRDRTVKRERGFNECCSASGAHRFDCAMRGM